MKEKEKGRCSVCGLYYELHANGKLKAHKGLVISLGKSIGMQAKRCRGSGRLPEAQE